MDQLTLVGAETGKQNRVVDRSRNNFVPDATY